MPEAHCRESTANLRQLAGHGPHPQRPHPGGSCFKVRFATKLTVRHMLRQSALAVSQEHARNAPNCPCTPSRWGLLHPGIHV